VVNAKTTPIIQLCTGICRSHAALGLRLTLLDFVVRQGLAITEPGIVWQMIQMLYDRFNSSIRWICNVWQLVEKLCSKTALPDRRSQYRDKIAGVSWQAQCMHCAQRTPQPWMAEAGFLARQDAELRTILDNAIGVSPRG
jgi:hypothetical protein